MILLLAASLDYLIGDPWGWPHPVRVMGWVISLFTNLVLFQWNSSSIRRWAGIFLSVGLIVGSGFVGWVLVLVAKGLHPLVGLTVESILLASCFALRSLQSAAIDVLQPLTTGELAQARSNLSQYVGRDTQKLNHSEIFRAVLETVAENATDGVMAPLFYAIVGAFFPGIGSVPFALAYKAASTIDSMIGYRSEPYQDLGWFGAKLEDILTWLPCRLTVITISVVSGKP
ncbi:MAG: cobalamin biosynthesis protein CobD, partial [Merismopedia sp. SIO2A8]|nr:cobalamin biosynthesis protein CobD [Merismopedia sp. SIO2A8]